MSRTIRSGAEAARPSSSSAASPLRTANTSGVSPHAGSHSRTISSSDLGLPGMSGEAVLGRIRALPLTREVPVLALTSSVKRKSAGVAGIQEAVRRMGMAGRAMEA